MLLNHSPVKRPSSEDLLKSEDIPKTKVQVKRLEEQIKAELQRGNKKFYQETIQWIHNQRPKLSQDMVYDSHSIFRKLKIGQLVAKAQIRSRLAASILKVL